jgi:2-polyprenyl-3-methyl-5-hydroxy-6-metoxy-1,4-benzoquinol methylase
LPRNARTFLDVGCGRGGFAVTIRAVSPQAFISGIEILPEQAREAALVMDEIIIGRIPNVFDQLMGRSFDCIVLNDILEHLEDPWMALQRIKEIAHPNTVIVASIPNVQFLPVSLNLLIRGNWEYTDYGILDVTHLRFFTRKSIIELFVGCGFDMDTIEGVNSLILDGRKGVLRPFLRALGDRRWVQYAVVARPIKPTALS